MFQDLKNHNIFFGVITFRRFLKSSRQQGFETIFEGSRDRLASVYPEGGKLVVYMLVCMQPKVHTRYQNLSLRTETHAMYSPTARIVTNASTRKAKNQPWGIHESRDTRRSRG